MKVCLQRVAQVEVFATTMYSISDQSLSDDAEHDQHPKFYNALYTIDANLSTYYDFPMPGQGCADSLREFLHNLLAEQPEDDDTLVTLSNEVAAHELPDLQAKVWVESTSQHDLRSQSTKRAQCKDRLLETQSFRDYTDNITEDDGMLATQVKLITQLLGCQYIFTDLVPRANLDSGLYLCSSRQIHVRMPKFTVSNER